MIEIAQFTLTTIAGFAVATLLIWLRHRIHPNSQSGVPITHALFKAAFTKRGWRDVIGTLAVLALIIDTIGPHEGPSPLRRWLTGVQPTAWEQWVHWPWLDLFFVYLLLTIVFACLLSPEVVARAWSKAHEASKNSSDHGGPSLIRFFEAFLGSLLANVVTARKQ